MGGALGVPPGLQDGWPAAGYVLTALLAVNPSLTLGLTAALPALLAAAALARRGQRAAGAVGQFPRTDSPLLLPHL